MLNALDFVDVDEFDQSCKVMIVPIEKIVNILELPLMPQGTHTYVPLCVIGTDQEQNTEEAIWRERLTTMATALGLTVDPEIESEALSDLLVQTVRVQRTDHAQRSHQAF